MENTITYTMDDGTEYRLTYDNETGDGAQMHYLMHENGVLKLECKHHAVPGGLTEEDFRSVRVPGAFFNCLGRNLLVSAQVQLLKASGDPSLVQLAEFVRPHVALTPVEEEWLETVADRGHSVEIALQLAREAEVERFVAQLNPITAPADQVEVPGFFRAYWPAMLWAVAVTVVVALAIFVETR